MRHTDIEEKLKTAVEHSVPDVLDSILSRCEEQKGNMSVMDIGREKKKKRKLASFAAAAAAVLLLAGGGAWYGQSQAAYAVDSIVALDVNPSIELRVNKYERVIDAVAMNGDGRRVLGDMDLRDADLDVAVNAIVGSMLKQGYISDVANSILISVENQDTRRGEELQQRLSDEVDKLLSGSSIEGAIISQNLNGNKALKDMADKYGISIGKAALIQKLVAQDSRLTIEALKDVKINELNLLANSPRVRLKDVKSRGAASEKAYIGSDEAKRIALSHGGISQSNTRKLEVEMDLEDGRMIYEVEFLAGGWDYEYDIDARTGDILNVKREPQDGDWDDNDGSGGRDDDDWDDDWDDDDRPVFSQGNQGGQGSGSLGAVGDYISQAKARAAALDHAGYRASEVSGLKVKLDKDDGVYNVEFYAENTEYDYEINALTAEVVKADQEDADKKPSGQKNGKDSGDKAKNYGDDDDDEDDD